MYLRNKEALLTVAERRVNMRVVLGGLDIRVPGRLLSRFFLFSEQDRHC